MRTLNSILMLLALALSFVYFAAVPSKAESPPNVSVTVQKSRTSAQSVKAEHQAAAVFDISTVNSAVCPKSQVREITRKTDKRGQRLSAEKGVLMSLRSVPRFVYEPPSGNGKSASGIDYQARGKI